MKSLNGWKFNEMEGKSATTEKTKFISFEAITGGIRLSTERPHLCRTERLAPDRSKLNPAVLWLNLFSLCGLWPNWEGVAGDR